MSLFDRVVQSMVAVAAAPLFSPDFLLPRLRTGITPLSAASVAAVDAAFAVQAAELGLAEVALSQSALSRAVRDDVRDFARRMVEEHSQANAELTGLCAGKRVVVPLTPARADREERRRLESLPADDFDAAYAARMVADHERAVALFRLQRDDGVDADLIDFATRLTPMLEDHLQAARLLSHPPKARKGAGRTTTP